MELVDYLRMLRRQWVWVIVTVIVVTGIAAAYVTTAPKSYKATTELYIGSSVFPNSQNQNQAAQSASQYVFDRIITYAALADSPDVLRKVIADVNLSTTPDALAKQVNATVAPNSVLISIAATDADPATAARIADSAARNLRNYITALDVPVAAASAPLAISITRPATTPTAPDSPNRTLFLALGVLLGLTLGLVIASLRDQLRRSRPTGHSGARDDSDGTASPAPVKDGSVSLERALSSAGNPSAVTPPTHVAPVAGAPASAGSVSGARTTTDTTPTSH